MVLVGIEAPESQLGRIAMSNALVDERRHFIEKKLIAEGKIKVSELSDFFNVSSETIRKDLLYLEEKGVAKKGYGGAVVANSLIEPNILEKYNKFKTEKNSIAKKAIDYISDGMIILLDSGSTLHVFAKMLALKNNITVFTNSPKTAQILDDFKIETYLFGGRIRNNSNAIVGGWALRGIKEIRADIAVLGTSGFMDRKGPCVENFEEEDIKQAMIESANKVIVLGDASKAKTYSMIEYARWEEIDVFISNESMDKETKERLKDKVELILA